MKGDSFSVVWQQLSKVEPDLASALTSMSVNVLQVVLSRGRRQLLEPGGAAVAAVTLPPGRRHLRRQTQLGQTHHRPRADGGQQNGNQPSTRPPQPSGDFSVENKRQLDIQTPLINGLLFETFQYIFSFKIQVFGKQTFHPAEQLSSSCR